MKPVLALMTMTLCVASTNGSACRVVRVQQQYYAPYYEPVVAAVYAPIPVYVPAYSVGTAAQQQTATDPDLLQEIRLLRQAVERLGGPGNPQALKAPPVHVALMQTNCAQCHTGANAKGKFQLFEANGAAKEPTAEQLGLIIARVSSDDPKEVMPPPTAKPQPSVNERLRMIAGLTAPPTVQEKK